jgi:GT2 family glycosyltransferase
VTVAIPTYERGEWLLRTLQALLAQAEGAELLAIDQTPAHPREVADALAALERQRGVRILRRSPPSITAAMNTALVEARRPLVLFVDDDVLPAPDLIAAHARAHADDTIWAVAGQVLQPGQEPRAAERPWRVEGLHAYLDFPFWSSARAEIANGMAGNLSVRVTRALQVGGFDANFLGVAYRFETEFCRRLVRAGGRIVFEPRATLRHVQAARGGTRSAGRHECSASPLHGVGDYYFALREGRGRERLAYLLRRPLREVATRFHLRHPWWLPVKLLGEARALALALRLHAQGPRRLAGPRA